MKGQNIRKLEIMLVIIFILLWLMLITDRKIKDSVYWEWFEEDNPIHFVYLKEQVQEIIGNLWKDWMPILSYDEEEMEKGQFALYFQKVFQKEISPIQQYCLDYWDDNSNYDLLYADAIPEYFTESDEAAVEEKKNEAAKMKPSKNGQTYSLTKLMDYDYLLKEFYIVDETTELSERVLNPGELLNKDLSFNINEEEPSVLIYHTHGSETYKGDKGSVIDVGEYLKERLENTYHIKTIHDKTVYDQIDGELDRNRAYNFAGDSVSRILKENPSIKIVLDLHRDSVDESIDLVTDINGKETAQIMFFNGISYRKGVGDIDYLKNPNKQFNLAASLQMQLLAAKYFNGLTRKIYIKGYRYNLHLAKRAMLIEVGAQNNTLAQAKNAMLPLADLIYRMAKGEKAYE